MPALLLSTPSLCVRLSAHSRPNCGLSPLHSHPSFFLSPSLTTLTSRAQLTENKATLSPFPATLTNPVKPKPFVCHSYKKQGGWRVPAAIALQIWPSVSTVQFLASSTSHQSRVTSHRP